jgi:hypothetical protein
MEEWTIGITPGRALIVLSAPAREQAERGLSTKDVKFKQNTSSKIEYQMPALIPPLTTPLSSANI